MGSIAEVWSWLIHVPLLGWFLLAVAAVTLAAFIIYAVLEFKAGADPGRPGW